MKTLIVICCLLAHALGLPAARAQEPTNAAFASTTAAASSPGNLDGERPARGGQAVAVAPDEWAKLRAEIRNLPPTERAAKMKEFREKHGMPGPSVEMQKRREDLLKLPPEQRRAKVAEWRKQDAAAAPRPTVSEERRAQWTERLEALRTKQAAGDLSNAEKAQVERLERAEKAMTSPPTGKSAAKTEKN